MVKRQRDILKSIDALAAEEQDFLRQRIFAPVVRGQGIRVSIAGVVCRLRVRPSDFRGWGIFLPISHTEAMFERNASMTQRRQYLKLFPGIQMIICLRNGKQTCAVPANPADLRCQSSGALPLCLAEDAELFETIIARFDGSLFWFDQRDEKSDPSIAAYLRESLVKMADPESLSRRGLTAGQRNAYLVNYAARVNASKANELQRQQDRLRSTLAHAGAQLRDFSDAHGEYRVTFEFDGHRHTSIIGKRDMRVRSAGLCLSGMDGDFDLNSLVGVLREATQMGRLW